MAHDADRCPTPEPPYPYFWRTAIQREKEKWHRLKNELERRILPNLRRWKQGYKSHQPQVSILAKRLNAAEKCADAAEHGNEILRGRLESAEGERDHAVGRAEAAEKERDTLAEIVNDLYSEAPCPRCGFGITGACFGCMVRRVEKERDDATRQLAEFEARVQNEIAARRLAQEHGIGDRARIEELESERDEARGALAKWGHVARCACDPDWTTYENTTIVMNGRFDPRCAREVMP